MKELIAIFVSAIILCFWAFYNSFPLTFNSDTALYLDAAFYNYAGPDRSILYGLFMYYISFQHSLWFVVIAQAFIVSIVIFLYFKYFNPKQKFISWYIAYVVVITFFMGGSFNVCWLMSDVFTPVCILCIGLLLFVNNLKGIDKAIISFFTIISMAMHNSHFYIILFILVILIIGFILKPIRRYYEEVKLRAGRILFVISLAVTSTLFLSGIHYLNGGDFRSSRGGFVFFFGNLVEMGVVDTYLADKCDKKLYKICLYKDSIPNNFLWASNSPINKTNGWNDNKEYSAIIKDMLTTPKYLKTILYKSVLMALKQTFCFDTGEAGKPTPQVNNAIELYYPNEYTTFEQSRQSSDRLNFHLVNYMQTLTVALSFLIFLFVFLYRKMHIRYRVFIGFLLLIVFINAGICGIFSGVYPRYQARVVWLLPLPLFLYATENLKVNNLINKAKRK